MARPLRVLILEDNPDDAEMLVGQLRGAGFELDWHRVDTEKDYLASLDDRLDIILSDYAMPQFDGMRALELLKQRRLDIPFVMVSGKIGEDVAVQAMREGAADYLTKDQIARLAPAVKHVLAQKRLRQDGKQTERALLASEISYRRLFEAAKDGILILDVETGRIDDVNPFLLELLGYSKAEMIGKPVWQVGSFNDIISNKGKFAQLQEHGYVRYHNLPLETKDGRQIAVEFVSNVYQAGDKEVIQCNIRDITERRETEAKLRASRNEINDLRAALDRYASVAVTDLKGKITYVNDKFCATSQYSREELLGQDHRIINSGHHPKEFMRHLWTTIQHGMVWEGEIRNKAKDGSLYWNNSIILPLLDTDGIPHHYMAIRTAITERKDIEKTLRVSEISYRRLFEGACDGILILEVGTGLITEVNPFLIELLGFSRDELIGKTIDGLSPFKDLASNQAALERLLKDEHFCCGDLTLEARDGRRIAAELISNLYQAGDKKVIQCYVRDITERRQAEKKMRGMQDRLQAINRDLTKKCEEIQYFYHTLSHELKTPLTSAREFVSIVIDGLAGELNATQLNYLRMAKDSCTDLAVYINDLLDATRLETGKLHLELKTASPVAIVRRALAIVEPVATAKSIRLREDLDPHLTDVMMDESRIMQVLTNLLNNALKFTPAGGEVSVKLQEDPKSPETVRISVRDNGCGIPKDQIQNLFHRFYQISNGGTTPSKGVGLGLYLCREMVLLHGGSIWVESAPGRGSTFSFTIPKQVTLRATRVLLVDDDRELLHALCSALECNGFDVATAADGSEALERIGEKTPDVVVLDLHMEGFDGPSTLREIRKSLGSIPVIVQTGYPDSRLMQRALEFSPITLLLKPSPPKRLVEAIRLICRDMEPLSKQQDRRSPDNAGVQGVDPFSERVARNGASIPTPRAKKLKK